MNVVLTFSTRFPKSHSRHGESTNFVKNILDGQKIHTCRQNYDYWAEKISRLRKAGGYLSLRTWTGKPYASPQAEIMHVPAEVVGVQKLTLYVQVIERSDRIYFIEAATGGGSREIQMEDLARNDGLSRQDFEDWFAPLFIGEYTEVELAIIHFTKFRY